MPAVALAGPVLLLSAVRGFGALQRARFRAVLGVEIPAPPRGPAGHWALRPVRAWRAPATWRQLGYHLLALVGGTVGGVLVAACWSAPALAVAWFAGLWGDGPGVLAGLAAAVLSAAMLLAAPWVARGVARADEAAARVLLGPSRAEELALRVESLARSRAEIVAATDAERRRIERDLHDGAQQRLVSLAMNLGMARASLTDAPEPVRQVIEQAHDEATEALAELREFVRGLHPAVLNDRGLDAALSGIAAHAPLPVRLRVDVATPLRAHRRGRRLLRRVRGPDQRGQARQRHPRRGQRRTDRRPAARRHHRRRPRRRHPRPRRHVAGRRRHRPARPRPAGRRGRRHPDRREPARRPDH